MNKDITKRVSALLFSFLLEHVLYLLSFISLLLNQWLIILMSLFDLPILHLLNTNYYLIAMMMMVVVVLKAFFQDQRLNE